MMIGGELGNIIMYLHSPQDIANGETTLSPTLKVE